MSDRDTVHVIGAGLAGLTAAATLAGAGVPVVVHESSGRLGGRARTDERDGYRFDHGPHALYLGGPGHRVLSDLGVHPRGTQPVVRGVVVHRGQTWLAPTTPGGLLKTPLLSAGEKARLGAALARVGRLDPSEYTGVTAAEWVDDVVSTEVTRGVLHMLIRLATYVNAPDLLSAEVAIGQLQVGAKPGVLYLDDGWQQLVDALADRPGVAVETGRVNDLPDAAAVIVAVGGPAAAGRLVGHDYPDAVPADVACLDLGLHGPPPHPYALGVDVPMYAADHAIAARRAPAGGSAYLIAEYLAPDTTPDVGRLEEHARIIGVEDDMIATRRFLHRMSAVTAIPTAAAGGLAGRPGVAVPDRPGVFVAGDWVGPEGHLADASLASGGAAARSALAHLQRRPVVS